VRNPKQIQKDLAALMAELQVETNKILEARPDLKARLESLKTEMKQLRDRKR
jgi:hypothetical protein